jgi:hypothetical protein
MRKEEFAAHPPGHAASKSGEVSVDFTSARASVFHFLSIFNLLVREPMVRGADPAIRGSAAELRIAREPFTSASVVMCENGR